MRVWTNSTPRYIQRSRARWPRLTTFRPLHYPLEIAIAWLALCKGVPALLTWRVTINPVENDYPHWILQIWGGLLLISAVLILGGIVSHRFEALITGFKVLATGTAINVTVAIVQTTHSYPAYLVLYGGLTVCLTAKVISLRLWQHEAERLEETINGTFGSEDADPDRG